MSLFFGEIQEFVEIYDIYDTTILKEIITKFRGIKQIYSTDSILFPCSFSSLFQELLGICTILAIQLCMGPARLGASFKSSWDGSFSTATVAYLKYSYSHTTEVYF